MSPILPFRLTMNVEAMSENAVTEFSAGFLRARGFNVTPPGRSWETKGAFMKRLGLTRHDSIDRDIRLFTARDGTLLIRRSPGGRVLELLSNAAFDKFCTRNKRPAEAKLL